MPADSSPAVSDHAVRADRPRSVLVSRRTAAELTGLDLPQVDYWIRRGVVGTGGSGSRWLPRNRTTVDALALAVAVELRGRGVSVREIQAVLPKVLSADPEWHPMAELIDVDALAARLTAATSKVTTSTVPAVPAVPAEETVEVVPADGIAPATPAGDTPTRPRRRTGPLVIGCGVVAVVGGVVVGLVLPTGAATPEAPPVPADPAAVAPSAAPTSDPAAAPLLVPPPAAPSAVTPHRVLAPTQAAQPPATTAAAPAAPVAVPTSAPAAPAVTQDAPLPDDGAATREPSQDTDEPPADSGFGGFDLGHLLGDGR
jgi:hypothetical protein